MKPLIIAIAGIKRSGSTVQYNLVRIALEMAGYDVTVYGHNYRPAGNPQEGEAHLIKRHPFSKDIAETADHIFLTDRPDEDIIESLTRFEGKDTDVERIKDMRKHLDKWVKCKTLSFTLTYDLWTNNPFRYTCRIIRILDLEIDPYRVLEEFNKIRPPKEGQDPKTLLFSNHITSCK